MLAISIERGILCLQLRIVDWEMISVSPDVSPQDLLRHTEMANDN
jgi:hypothetical protein